MLDINYTIIWHIKLIMKIKTKQCTRFLTDASVD
jgi:hypothetical protein